MKAFLALLVLVSVSQAQAVHMYASSSCKSPKAKIALAYDGPGSNYAVGGYYNFYVDKAEEGLLANSNDVYEEEVGDVVSDKALEVTFISTDYRKVSETKTEKVDCSKSDGYEYEHSEWNAIQTIKIVDISKEASAKMKLKAGDSLVLLCKETSDEPVNCN